MDEMGEFEDTSSKQGIHSVLLTFYNDNFFMTAIKLQWLWHGAY